MRYRFAGLLLRPSFFSFALNIVLATVLLAAVNWSHLLERVFFYGSIFGPEGLLSSYRDEDNDTFIWAQVFNESTSYNIFIVLLAIAVGITVYVVLQLLSRAASNASVTWEVLHAQTNGLLKPLVYRSIIQLVIAVGWLAYTGICVRAILPFCVLASQSGVRQLGELQGLVFLLLSLGLLWLTLHGHVIFMRLICLRPRVFGGHDAVLTSKYRRV